MLAGRDAEATAIADRLADASAGTGGALVIRGVAGAGKSTLLADAVRAAGDMRVLQTSGVESESPLAFAALQRLLWPLRARIDALPTPQQKALRSALGEAEGEGDRFLAFLGTLNLLADAAEERPVLAIVDDAHWLDEASAAALLFVARRLHAERIALLFAARDGDPRRFEADDLSSIALGGVTGTDADALLSGGSFEVDPSVREQLVEATGGNPLALVELGRALAPDQLAGHAPLPAPLPLTGGVERTFLDRHRRLSESAQHLLLVAATDDTGRLGVVRAAARRLGADEGALDELERTQLLHVDEGVVTLQHPLVRSAIYRAASSTQRRAAHRALADELSDETDRRAWHLAAAADGPDGTVVRALDAVAERAAGRSGHEAASAAWARSAELSGPGEDRGRRLYLAASSAWLGAHPARAAELAHAAAAEVHEPRLRAQLLTLQGQIEWNTNSINSGHDFILRAAEAARCVDRAMARQLAMLAASLASFGARSSNPLDPVELVDAPAADAPARERAADALLRGFSAVVRNDWDAAATAFRHAFALTDAEPVDDHVLQPNLAIAAVLIDDDEHGLRLHDHQLTAARASGALPMIEHALTRGFHSQLATGAWSTAVAAAHEALPLTTSTGHLGLTALPTAELALVAALRGDDAADHHLATAASIRAARPVGITDGLVTDLAHWTSGLRAAGQPPAALQHLEQIAGPALRRLAALDVFDLAVRSGRPDVAGSWLEELTPFAEGTGAPSAIAVVEHGRALLATGTIAEDHFQNALDAHAQSLRRPDRARTELAYGEYLRRTRRRVDAREHLRTALSVFEDLGAAPWADRAAQELRASGETARRRRATTAAELTAQERHVAGLVREGLSNRDAAARLFVSPRTIDFHLRNVFSKLGISSRAELAALPLDV